MVFTVTNLVEYHADFVKNKSDKVDWYSYLIYSDPFLHTPQGVAIYAVKCCSCWSWLKVRFLHVYLLVHLMMGGFR